MSSQTSEQPDVWITYRHSETEDDTTFIYEGSYVPDSMLPFPVNKCDGERFTMDGIEFEIAGDLGGHVIYRRVNGNSALYTMPWEDFAIQFVNGSIKHMEVTT